MAHPEAINVRTPQVPGLPQACHTGRWLEVDTVIKGNGQPTLKWQLTCWYALSPGGARWNQTTDLSTTLLRPIWKKSGLLPGILWG